MSSNSDQSASLLNGHAQYAKGYVEETIGNVTGSEEWKQSGKDHAQQGIDETKVCIVLPTCWPSSRPGGRGLLGCPFD